MPPRSSTPRRAAAAALLGIATLTACGAPPAGAPASGSATIAPPPPAGMQAAGVATIDEAAPPAGSRLPGAAAQAATIRRLAARGRPAYCGGGTRRLVALTFDDGPGPLTGALLRELRRAGARATFFLVGHSIGGFEQWPRRQRERGAIGTHTQTHVDLTALEPAVATAEIADGRAAALSAAGAPVDLFRAPYGRRTAAIDREVRRQGMLEVLWDVNSTDSRRSPPAGFDATVAARVRRLARPGSIVLLHENRAHTIRALRSILPALKRRHLRLVTVSELLAADPPSAAQLDAGERGCRAGWAR